MDKQNRHSKLQIEFLTPELSEREETEKLEETTPVTGEISKQWPQYLAVGTGTIASFACGTHFAWTSSAIPIIISDDFPVKITKTAAAYIPVIGPIGSIVAAPITAILADAYGRKLTVLLVAAPLIISWIIIAFANSIWLFYLARLIGGVGDGAEFVVIPMYIGEVSEPKIRGVLGSFVPLFFIVGMLFIDCIGPYLSLANSAYVCITFPVLLLCSFSWMPESPYYYLMKGKIEAAKKSLQFLRHKIDVDAELTRLTGDVNRQISEPTSFRNVFTRKTNLKAFLIIVGLRTLQQFSGISAFALNAHTIFMQASKDISANLSVIIYMTVQVIMIIIGSFSIDRFGRKPILLFSCIGCCIVLTVTAVYFFLKEKSSYDLSIIKWLPLASMLCYVCFYSLGLGTIPHLMLGELFSASIKATSLYLSNIYYALLVSIVTLFYELTANYFGMYVPFASFAFCCFLGSFFSYFCVPETKNRSLEHIQQFLRRNTWFRSRTELK